MKGNRTGIVSATFKERLCRAAGSIKAQASLLQVPITLRVIPTS